MSALKQARKLIEKSPSSKEAQTLSKLVVSLETDQAMALKEIYDLSYESFQLAMDISFGSASLTVVRELGASPSSKTLFANMHSLI